MSEIEIIFKKTVANSPCMAMLLTGYAELVSKGWAGAFVPFGNRSSVVYAKQGDDILGAIVFVHDPDLETVHIQLSYIDAQYRGNRIHQKLHFVLQDHARTIGARRITSHVHKDNDPLLQASTRSGMATRWHIQVLDL